MLSTLLGVNGVPLLYVIREKEEAEPEGHNTFVQKGIACAPLTGLHFEADARKVHQLATSFTQGSEQWIKMHVKKQNGQVDLKALCAHYQGAGNTTRRIAEATPLCKTLHYKSHCCPLPRFYPGSNTCSISSKKRMNHSRSRRNSDS
jgi:hypothetical protein